MMKIMMPRLIWSLLALRATLKYVCGVALMLIQANHALHRLFVPVSAECTRLGQLVVLQLVHVAVCILSVLAAVEQSHARVVAGYVALNVQSAYALYY